MVALVQDLTMDPNPVPVMVLLLFHSDRERGPSLGYGSLQKGGISLSSFTLEVMDDVAF